MGGSSNGGFPQQPWGFPTKNAHFGVWNGGTTTLGNTYVDSPVFSGSHLPVGQNS